MSAPAKDQNFANHARFVPGFHFVTGILVLVVLGWSLYRLVTIRSADTVLFSMVAIVLLAHFIYLRAFPLAVQDRLIRLEERLRLARLLPADVQGNCDDLTADQLIALRFASDSELPSLVKRVLDEKILDRKTIKSLIVSWRPDNLRA